MMFENSARTYLLETLVWEAQVYLAALVPFLIENQSLLEEDYKLYNI